MRTNVAIKLFVIDSFSIIGVTRFSSLKCPAQIFKYVKKKNHTDFLSPKIPAVLSNLFYLFIILGAVYAFD